MAEKIKAKVKELATTVQEDLALFIRFANEFRGKEDAKVRPNLILNSDNNLTTSNLTSEEQDYINSANFMAHYFPEANCMKVFADIHLQSSKSKTGWAVDKVIEYEQALSEKRMIQLGLKPQAQEAKEKSKTNATKE